MALLIFHLVLSSFTFEGVDIHMAQKILDYHIERYPNGERLVSSSFPISVPDELTPHTSLSPSLTPPVVHLFLPLAWLR